MAFIFVLLVNTLKLSGVRFIYLQRVKYLSGSAWGCITMLVKGALASPLIFECTDTPLASGVSVSETSYSEVWAVSQKARFFGL